MKQRLLLLLFASMLIGLGATLFSGNPPTTRTNAPGESNCTACHSGVLNNGPGSLSLNVPSSYTPGTTYNLTMSLVDNTRSRFGFSATVLNGSNAAAGTLIRTNTTNTSLQTASVSGGTRQYIGHRNANTTVKSWSFQWTAPATNVGPVTFYAAGNATNNNFGTTGDNVYAQSFVIQPAATPPSASFTPASLSHCIGGPLTFTDNSSGGVTTYNWDFGAGALPATSTMSGPHNIVYANPGTKTIRLIVSNAAGADTSFATVVVHAQPVVTLSGILARYCDQDASSQFIGTPAGGTFFGTGSGGATFDPAIAGLGTHLIKYAYTDSNGCSSADSTTISVLASPDPGLMPNDTSICQGTNLRLSATPGFLNYQWSTGASTALIFVDTAATYSVTVTGINFCTGTDSVNIAVVQALMPTFGQLDTTLCDNEPAVTVQPTPAGGTFSGAVDANGMFDPQAAGAGMHSFSYSVMDTTGCSGSISTNFTVFAAPDAEITGFVDSAITSICRDDAVLTLAGTPSGGTFAGKGISGSDFDPAVADSGINYVTYTITTADGCSDSTVLGVNVIDLALPLINQHDPDSLSTAPGYTSYQWVFLNVMTGDTFHIAGATGRAINFKEQNANPQNTNVYVVYVTGPESCGKMSPGFTPFTQSIDPAELLSDLRIYPNPTANLLEIDYLLHRPESISVSLIDIRGKTVWQKTYPEMRLEGHLQVETRHLPEGFYLLNLDVDGQQSVRKVVVRR